MSKASIFSDLRALGVELSPSKLKKTTMAELQALLDAKHAEIAREQETRKAKHAASNKVVTLPRTTKKRSRVHLAPKPASSITPARAGSKQAALIDALARPEGATADELARVTAWQRSAIHGALYLDINKVRGYGVVGTRDGDAIKYYLVLPTGWSKPLPHKPRAGATAPTRMAANRTPSKTGR